MKTQTIKDIEKQVTEVQEALKGFVVSAQGEENYGSAQEYTPKSLKDGINAILTDIQGLMKAHKKFVAVSTHNERSNISANLSNFGTHIVNQNYNGAAVHLDELKTIIRGYNVRTSSETQEVLEERIHKLYQLCSTLEENLVEIENIKEKSELAKDKIQSSQEVLGTLDSLIQELQNKTAEIENLRVQSEQGHQSVEQTMTEAKSHAEIIEHFSQQVESRQQQIDKQQVITEEYQAKLKLYTAERAEKIKEAEGLISQARNALGYKTAEGISAAIYERYTEEKAKRWVPGAWLLWAGLCLVGSIGIGVWLVLGKDTADLGLVLGRIAIMSAAISGAWFCATQYVKYKNILEDYGYKSVLAKSIVAFLDLLTGEERERYLEIVLTEIHKDPLRKRHDYDSPTQGFMASFRRGKKGKATENTATPPD